ncbi:MAG TPA: MFS transporter [Acidimicrobiales bacterium]|nr:MFS transporter [Acidimicrobiales bacterium]
MTRVVTEAVVDATVLDEVRRPRRGFVLETAAEGAYLAEEGPVHDYRREVTTEALPDGRSRVRQVVEYRLAVPYFGFLFAPGVRRLLGRLDERRAFPWWAPPQRVDARAATALGVLCALSWIVGYMGTILTQTVTYAADEFGSGKGAQGFALALVRFDVIVTVFVVALADRRGRRTVLLHATTFACVLTALCSLAPSLLSLAGAQVLARGFVTAGVLILAIAVAEEMPAGARAYGVSLLALAAGGGAGMCVLLLPVCDLATWSWRLLYLVPLAAVPLVRRAGRRLPESRRFRAPHAEVRMAGRRGRFWLLAASGFLLNLFLAPASQFQNEYLRDERGFSGGRVSLFTVVTATPGFLGVVVGGRLAERGRRLVGAVAVVVGVWSTVLVYVGTGWSVWAWSTLGSIVAAATIPALGVYGPELFPTALRGRANGVITGLARLGSVVGLLVAGTVADATGRLGPAMTLLAIGPTVLALLVLVAYPETAHRELEELNPEDAPPRAVPGEAEGG